MLNRRDYLKTVIKGWIAAAIFPNICFASLASDKGHSKSEKTGIFKYVISRGVVAVLSRNGVSERDLQRVLEAVRGFSPPPPFKITQVFPMEYIVDCKKGIKNPLGMGRLHSMLEVEAVVIMEREDGYNHQL